VQRSIAYDRKDSQAGTRLTVSRAKPMGTHDLMEQICSDNYEYSQMPNNEQSRHPEEPDTEYLLEHNVRQNFGTEEQSSAKWYKYIENSQRPYWRFCVKEKVWGTKSGLIKTNLVHIFWFEFIINKIIFLSPRCDQKMSDNAKNEIESMNLIFYQQKTWCHLGSHRLYTHITQASLLGNLQAVCPSFHSKLHQKPHYQAP
jgi:hypothetical protein